MHYAFQRAKQRRETSSYRNYVTESLRMIPQGMYFSTSFSDALKPHESIDVDATIESVKARLEGLK